MNKADLTDEIILTAQAGDQSSLEEIFVAYKSVIRSIANSYFLIGGDKEDLLQEGMFGLYKAVRDYRVGVTTFNTFAYTCILRQIINVVKRYSGTKNKVQELCVPLDDELVAGLIQDPLERVISHENQVLIRQQIDTKLSSLEKKVLNLFIKGYSYEEISRIVGKSVKAVDGALQRIRKKLAQIKEG